MSTTIVPANPGFYVLTASHGGGAPFVLDRYAVIAWELFTDANGTRQSSPVTLVLGSVTDFPAHVAVQRPDGAVESPYTGRSYANAHKWLADGVFD